MPGFFFQLKSFGVSLIIGVGGGWLYDLYRVYFQVMKWRSRILTTCGDVSFWLIFTALTSVFLFTNYAGEVRFYTFLGIAAGFLFYRRFFHRYGVIFWKSLCTALLHFFGVFRRPLLFSFRFLQRFFPPLRRRRAGGPEID
uniref:Spore cortex biosynthesis protein YabQ n=1 Tax=Ammonifex degensii TaxID=42838 RepID=A0A7C1FDD7_9THEO